MSKYFMIGINGVGMSGLACVLKDLGHEVIGSDIDAHFFTQDFLDKFDIKKYTFEEYDFDSDYTVIVGNSFNESFPEYEKALKQGNEILYYYQFLGELSKSMPSVAVTGTHGKTTTTTMVRDVLSINNDISYLIGDGHGQGVKDSKYFVFEACEYKDHFLSYYPKYAIVTNVGHDHVDYFPTREVYADSFLKFGSNVSKHIIVCGDDDNAYEIFKDNDKAIFYGISSHCYSQARNIKYTDSGSNFDIYIDDKFICNFDTESFGQHNILNLLATLTVAYLEGEDLVHICSVYNGKIQPKRRFEEYIYDEQIVIDDNAHHPNEVRSFIDAVLQKYPDKKIIAALEPHTVERLVEHKSTFAKQLNRCDEQLLLPVKIPIRDKEKYANGHVDTDIMLDELENGMLYDENTYEYLLSKKNWVVLFMGVTILTYAEEYIDKCNLLFNRK